MKEKIANIDIKIKQISIYEEEEITKIEEEIRELLDYPPTDIDIKSYKIENIKIYCEVSYIEYSDLTNLILSISEIIISNYKQIKYRIIIDAEE